MKRLIIGVGNIYLDYNAFGVELGEEKYLKVGKDYFAEKAEEVLGGSAVNFLSQVKEFDFPVAFVGQVGKDENGSKLKNLLEEAGIKSELVSTSDSDQTSVTFNAVFADSAEFVGVHWGKASKNFSQEQLKLENPLYKEALAVYFGGTAKQRNIFSNTPSIFQRIKTIGAKIVYDPNRFVVEKEDVQKETFLSSLQYVDIYLPNEDEIMQATMCDVLDNALDLAIEKGASIIVVKLGANGCRVKTKNEDILIPGFNITPVTTVGAGDCFNAGFVSSFFQGKSLKDSGLAANAVAAVKVSKNKYASPEEVEDLISSLA